MLKWFFFVQSILADHRKEMWVVSLKSSFSVEFETKKNYLKFVFDEEWSRIEILSEKGIISMILLTFSEIFLQIKIFF